MVHLSHLKFITYSESKRKLQYNKRIVHIIEIIDQFSCLKFVQRGQNHQKLKVFDYDKHSYQQPYSHTRLSLCQQFWEGLSLLASHTDLPVMPINNVNPSLCFFL